MPATTIEWCLIAAANATLVPLCTVTISGERFNSHIGTSGFVVSFGMSTTEAASRIEGFCGSTLHSTIMVPPATSPWSTTPISISVHSGIDRSLGSTTLPFSIRCIAFSVLYKEIGWSFPFSFIMP